MSRQQGDDIGVFLAACGDGSFVAAAIRLHLSPSAVAKAIARVESRLGVRLFQRTTRTLRLTAEGATYRDVCLEARHKLEGVEAGLRAISKEPAGRLRVSLPPLFGAEIIAPALYGLYRKWPGLELSISTTATTIDLVADEVDLAVRIGELPDTSLLIARFLGTQKVVLCASPSYVLRKGIPTELSDLASHEVVAERANGRTRPWRLTDRDENLVDIQPREKLLLDGSLLTLAAALDGLGIALLPEWLVRDHLLKRELIAILQDCVSGHLPVHVVWPSSPIMLPRLRVAIDAVIEAVAHRLNDEGQTKWKGETGG